MSAALVAKHKGNAQTLRADVGITLVLEEVEKLEALRSAADKEYVELTTEIKRLNPPQSLLVDDLVGVFGPEKLASRPWYKKLFG